MIHYQQAAPSQLAQLEQLWLSVFGDTPAFIHSFYLHWFPRGIILTALDGAETVGMLHLLPLEGCGRDAPDQLLYCYACAVRPDHRGQGICTELFRQAAAIGQRRKADLLLVPANQPLVILYERYGFRTVPFYSIASAGYKPAAPMHARLSEPEPSAYAAIRQHCFDTLPYTGFWDPETLRFVLDDLKECGGFHLLLNVSGTACAVLGTRRGDTLDLTELAAPAAQRDALFQLLLRRFGCRQLKCRVPFEPSLPCRSGMILPHGGSVPESCWFPLDLL